MAIDNPLLDHYDSVMLSPLMFSGKKNPLQISPLTGFSNEDLERSNLLFATHQEENTVENVALALEFAELEDAPLYRSFGGRGVSKSSDDMLVAARGYREAEQVRADLTQGRWLPCCVIECFTQSEKLC